MQVDFHLLGSPGIHEPVVVEKKVGTFMKGYHPRTVQLYNGFLKVNFKSFSKTFNRLSGQLIIHGVY